MGQTTENEGIIPARWPREFDLPTLHCNNFAIARAGDAVYITFGELRPMILSGYSPEELGHLREEGVAVKPLAAIAVTNDGHRALTELLVNALEIEDLEKLVRHIERLIQERQE
jgi:hypothetical protein